MLMLMLVLVLDLQKALQVRIQRVAIADADAVVIEAHAAAAATAAAAMTATWICKGVAVMIVGAAAAEKTHVCAVVEEVVVVAALAVERGAVAHRGDSRCTTRAAFGTQESRAVPPPSGFRCRSQVAVLTVARGGSRIYLERSEAVVGEDRTRAETCRVSPPCRTRAAGSIISVTGSTIGGRG